MAENSKKFTGTKLRGTGRRSRNAPAQGAPRASAEEFQMRRTQRRAKSGASAAAKEGETVGVIEGVPAVAKTQVTVAGTEDKICCETPAAVASSGAECGVVAAWQQAILPPQRQQLRAGCAAAPTGDWAATTWPQRSIRLQMMVNANFTFIFYPSCPPRGSWSCIFPDPCRNLFCRTCSTASLPGLCT